MTERTTYKVSMSELLAKAEALPETAGLGRVTLRVLIISALCVRAYSIEKDEAHSRALDICAAHVHYLAQATLGDAGVTDEEESSKIIHAVDAMVESIAKGRHDAAIAQVES